MKHKIDNHILYLVLILLPLILLLLCYNKNNYENFELKKILGLNKSNGKNTNLNNLNNIMKSIESDDPKPKIINIDNEQNNIESDKKDLKKTLQEIDNFNLNSLNNNSKKNSYDDEKLDKISSEDDIKKLKKDIPIGLNIKEQSKMSKHNDITDFDKKRRQCQFYEDKCPNGYTSFGSFSLIGESSLICGGNNKNNKKQAKAVPIIKNGKVIDAKILDGGSGYTENPKSIIVGNCKRNAKGECIIDDNGSVVAINITDKGHGYKSTPEIKIDNPSASECYMCCLDN
jgi:hypothetical protein